MSLPPKLDLFITAKNLAIQKHAQQQYSTHPYYFHLYMVVSVLQRFGLSVCDEHDNEILCAAFLHDTLEDTDLTFAEIENVFGNAVANVVWSVTDEGTGDRNAKKLEVYKKLQKCPDGIILKLADRISNVEFCLLEDNQRMFDKYKLEQQLFHEMLFPVSQGNEVANKMWHYLSTLFEIKS